MSCMLGAAELRDLPWCETEDGFQELLGGFSLLGLCLAPPHAKKAHMWLCACMKELRLSLNAWRAHLTKEVEETWRAKWKKTWWWWWWVSHASAVQVNQNDSHKQARLTRSWWGGFHYRMPTNKRNSGMTLGHLGRAQPGDIAIPQIPQRGIWYQMDAAIFSWPLEVRGGDPILGETRLRRHDKVQPDSCGLISNPHEPLLGAAGSQSVIW